MPKLSLPKIPLPPPPANHVTRFVFPPMEDTLILQFSSSALLPNSFPKHPSLPKLTLSSQNTSLHARRLLSSLRSPAATIPQTAPTFPHFAEKLLFLDSLNLDHLSLISSHPPILATSLSDLRSTVDFLRSLDLNSLDLRRIFTMCPQILTTKSHNLTAAITFLLREAGVNGAQLRHVIHRRPRLLVSDVSTRLRPTLYFLQMLGITETSRHSYLLSCSVEEKLIPRIEFFQNYGFTLRDSRSMFRRFPQLFNYSMENNLEVKFRFLVDAMRRELREVKEFPQYFSYSLEKRIKRRHLVCEETGVLFTLPALLKPNDEEFRERVEVCVGSSLPLRRSLLWYENLDSCRM